MTWDAIVIGAGHNGLVTAGLLGRAGRRVLVLERRDRVGGLLDTVEVAPGAHAPGPMPTVGRLRASVASSLGLDAHGLRTVTPSVRVFAPQPDGSSLTLWADPQRTAADLASRSAVDAAAWPRFDGRIRALAGFIGAINRATPPDVRSPDVRDALTGLGLGRAFRRLGAREGREATRLIPMAIADMVAEEFTDPALRAALAVRGIRHTSMGPWSAGTAAVFLSDAAEGDGGAAGEATVAIGGPAAGRTPRGRPRPPPPAWRSARASRSPAPSSATVASRAS